MNSDYLAAVDRLRRVASGEGLLDVYGYNAGHDLVDYVADKITVYDAEHDQTPASVEWLRECGLLHNEVFRIICNGGPIDNQKTIAICGVGFVKLNPTRGDVLTLLRMFKERRVYG